MHKLDLEAARGTSGRLFPSVCLLLKADERWGQTAWIQGPNPSRLCTHIVYAGELALQTSRQGPEIVGLYYQAG